MRCCLRITVWFLVGIRRYSLCTVCLMKFDFILDMTKYVMLLFLNGLFKLIYESNTVGTGILCDGLYILCSSSSIPYIDIYVHDGKIYK